MKRKRHRRPSRRRRNPVTGTAKVRWNPTGNTGKIVIAVLATVVVAGGVGAAIYFAKKPAGPQLPGTGLPATGGGGGVQAAADAAAAKAAADKAQADAVAAAVAAATKAAADALRNTATNAAKSAFSTKHDLGGASSSAELDAWAFIAAIQAVQAAGVAPVDVLGIVWNAAADWFASRGYGRSQAEGFATAAQLAAGFGQHQGGGAASMQDAFLGLQK